MKNITKKDYIIARVDKKKLLLRVDEVAENGDVVCTVENTRHKDPERVSVRSNEIVANLGREPSNGKAYGVTIETWKKTVDHDLFGQINFFHEMAPEQEGRLLRAFDKVASILKHHGVDKFFPINVEVRPPVGKKAGCYKFSGKDSEEHPDTLVVYPKDEYDYVYIIAHECGHGIYTRLFRSPKGRAAWIKLYHSYITITQLTDEDLQELIEKHLTKTSPSDGKSQMDEDELEIFAVMLKFVKRTHSLTIKDLDILFDSEEDLSEYWPVASEISKKTYEVSEYAMTKNTELFAESVAFHFQKKKLPVKVTKLLEKTLSAASNSRSA